jgi:hypothetical protein
MIAHVAQDESPANTVVPQPGQTGTGGEAAGRLPFRSGFLTEPVAEPQWSQDSSW